MLKLKPGDLVQFELKSFDGLLCLEIWQHVMFAEAC